MTLILLTLYMLMMAIVHKDMFLFKVSLKGNLIRFHTKYLLKCVYCRVNIMFI